MLLVLSSGDGAGGGTQGLCVHSHGSRSSCVGKSQTDSSGQSPSLALGMPQGSREPLALTSGSPLDKAACPGRSGKQI